MVIEAIPKVHTPSDDFDQNDTNSHQNDADDQSDNEVAMLDGEEGVPGLELWRTVIDDPPEKPIEPTSNNNHSALSILNSLASNASDIAYTLHDDQNSVKANLSLAAIPAATPAAIPAATSTAVPVISEAFQITRRSTRKRTTPQQPDISTGSQRLPGITKPKKEKK